MSSTRTPGHQVGASILAALADVEAAPAGWVSPSVVLHVHLPADVTASSQATTRRLLDAHVRVVGGSAGPSGERVLMAAGSPAQWTRFAAFLTGRGTARAVADVRAPSVAEVVRTRPTPAPGGWSATLHPDLCGSPAHAGPACSAQLEAFAAAIEQVGGVAHLDTRRTLTAGTLSYVPVRLPDEAAAVRLGQFNALRRLEPAAQIALR